jgi:chemotaxis protein CheD
VIEVSSENFKIRIAEYLVKGSPSSLKISGLGSCVALALYDQENKMGGVAHILLPGPAPKGGKEKGPPGKWYTKYADRAISRLIGEMEKTGSESENLVAKIAGGANMFASIFQDEIDSDNRNSVGHRNVEAVKENLRKKSIPVQGEDTGGNVGRTVIFELSTGEMFVNTKRGRSVKL